MPHLTDRRSILEAIRKEPQKARRLWVQEGYERAYRDLLDEARLNGVAFRVTPEEDFARRFPGVRHICLDRDVYAAEGPDVLLASMGPLEDGIISVFDGLYDPQNLGNLLRTAACLGVDGVVLPKDRTSAISDTVVRVSRGGVGHVRLIRVVNVARFLEDAKKKGFFCYAFEEKGERDLWEVDLTGKACLVFGSEEGLRPLTRKRSDVTVRIPTGTAFSSLNVATAFALALGEAKRQRAVRSGRTR